MIDDSMTGETPCVCGSILGRYQDEKQRVHEVSWELRAVVRPMRSETTKGRNNWVRLGPGYVGFQPKTHVGEFRLRTRTSHC